MRRRTKIVATVGPSCAAPQMLKKLIDAGVDTFRLNFSHGSHDEHGAVHARYAPSKRNARGQSASCRICRAPNLGWCTEGWQNRAIRG